MNKNDSEIRSLIFSQNMKWFSYLPFILIPLNAIHIVLYLLKIEDSIGNEKIWRLNIIAGHSIMLLLSIALWALVIYQRRNKTARHKYTSLGTLTVGFLLVADGVFISLSDQLVTSAITPYFIVSIGIAIIYIMRPIESVILLITNMIALVLLLPYFQTNSDVIFSNQVNALFITAISILISTQLWRITTTRHHQLSIIDQQNEKLKKNNELLQIQTLKLQELNATKDKFFSIIAHDLRSPFNTINTLTELIKEEVSEKNFDNLNEYSSMLSTSAERAMELLTNLMTWAMTQNGGIITEKKELLLPKVIQEVTDIVGPIARKKSLIVDVDVDSTLKLYADENMLNTILRNLIINAIKFTFPKGKVAVKAWQDSNSVKISVSDSGIGMSQSIIDGLFKPGSKSSRPGTKGEASTGLGLIICKEFVERHGGQIFIESKEGSGSVFTVEFPKQESLPN